MRRDLEQQNQACRFGEVDQWMQAHAITRAMTSHVLLAFFYGIFLFLYEIIFFREMIPVVHPILILWAGALILYDLVIRRYWKRLPYWQILAVFAGICLISGIMNRESGLVVNFKSYIMIMLPLGVFYPICLMEKKEKRNKSFLFALLGGAIIIFIASSVAVVLYLMRYSQTVTYNGITKVIGFRYYLPNDPTSGMLLYGVYNDTNHAAIYALAFAAYSLFGFMECRKGMFAEKWKNTLGSVFFACNFVIQILYFPLANSRGGWLSLLVSLLLVSFLFFYGKKFKNVKPVLRFGLALVLALGCTFLVYEAEILGRTVMVRGSAAIHEVIGNPMDDFSDHSGEITDSSKHPWDNIDSSEFLDEEIGNFTKKDAFVGSGRIGIWKNAMQLYSHNPIWGIGPNHRYYAEKYDLKGTPMWKGTAVHNSYLDLLLNYGVIAFVALMTFCLLCFISVLKACWKKGKTLLFPFYMTAFIAVLVACGSFFLSCVFINTTAMYFVLLISMGYLMAECKQSAEIAA